MNKTYLPNYDLSKTLLGGQSFVWDLIDGYYYGFTKNRIIKLKKEKDYLFWQTYSKNDDFDFIEKYLRLNVDYENILKTISKDRHIENAIKQQPNLRLLNQDFEETLLAFILSSNNTIKSIRKSVRLLAQDFGEKIKIDGINFHFFPKAEVIAAAGVNDLMKSKIGFRAKYLKSAATNISADHIFTRIGKMNEAEARKNLIQLNGVGDKIADCVLVFGLAHDDVTPLDVWARRVFVETYKLDYKMKYEDMRNWIKNYFNGYSAWAGQFLFEYERGKFTKNPKQAIDK